MKVYKIYMIYCKVLIWIVEKWLKKLRFVCGLKFENILKRIFVVNEIMLGVLGLEWMKDWVDKCIIKVGYLLNRKICL